MSVSVSPMVSPLQRQKTVGRKSKCEWGCDSDHARLNRLTLPIPLLGLPSKNSDHSRSPLTTKVDEALEIISDDCDENANDAVPQIITVNVDEDRSPTSIANTAIFGGLAVIPLSLDKENNEDFAEDSTTAKTTLSPKPPRSRATLSFSCDSSTVSLASSTLSFRKRSRRKVRFGTMVMVQHTLSRMDMSPEEITSYWLQPEEFARIAERDQAIVVLIEQEQYKIKQWLEEHQAEQENTTRKKRICTRGLESRLMLESLRKKSHRLMGLEEVLLEQERQWDAHGEEEFCIYDFDAFRMVYERISKECKIQAEQVARKDRLAVDRLNSMCGGPKASSRSRRLTMHTGEEEISYKSTSFRPLGHRRSSM